jgi:membrane fusion protein (multidrug efflux system)
MNKSAIIATATLCVAIAAGAGFWFGAQRARSGPADASVAVVQPKGGAAASGGAPMAVEAARVARQPLPQTITAVGSLRSDESVTLRPEVAGRVNAILFKEGQNVRQGMTLVRLDPAINAAEVQQAKANLTLAKSKYDRAVELSQRNFISGQAKDEAEVLQAKANLTLAKAKYDRAVDLQKQGFISGQARDEAENSLKVMEAAVALAAAKLAKMEIRAPFSGLIGLRSISVGEYV